MNSKVFSITGWILMVLGSLVPLGMILMQIMQVIQRNGLGINDIFGEGLLPAVIIFVLVFLPGLNYYHISKKGKSNGLENWSIILAWISLVLLIFLLLYGILMGDLSMGVLTSIAWTMFILGPFALIPYAVGILLLVINWFRKKV